LEPDKKKEISDHRIDCPRFGGVRLAASCCTQDRYKSCRRRCKVLAQHLKEYPNLPNMAKDHYKVRYKDSTLMLCYMKSAGKNLPPDPTLECRLCGFVAKSLRGLKTHMGRTHELFDKKKRKRKNKAKKRKMKKNRERVA